MKHYKEHYETINNLYHEAANLILKGEKLPYVEEILNTLLLNDPNSPILVFQLANVNMKKKHYPASEILFLKTIELNPDFIEVHMNLGCVYKEMQMLDKARECFKKVIDLAEKQERTDEDKSIYWQNYASTFVANGSPEEALKFIEKSIELNPKNDEAYWNRGLAYLELGDYEKGFKDYEYGVRISQTKNRNYSREITPFWDGTPGKTVVVYGEQGIGDELMFASMLPDIMKDCDVILDLHPRLADMFRNTYPNIPVFGTRKMSKIEWAQYYKVEAKVSIATLGKFYRKSLEDFPGIPYLKSIPSLVEKYKQKLSALSNRKKIGISWKGGSAMTGMDERKIKLKQLLPLLELDEQVDFISLQYHEDTPVHLKSLKENFGKTIHHWQDVMDDYDETAGLVSNLDYIISVPQSVVHLAGALGISTLQMCPKRAMWQMGPHGRNMPWYSCVENIWQEEPRVWDNVVLQAKEKLCSLLQNNI